MTVLARAAETLTSKQLPLLPDAAGVAAPRATVPCVEWRVAFIVPSGEMRRGVRSPEVWSVGVR